MDSRAVPIITRQLGSDERLLWAGRPRRGIVLRGSDAFLIPFSLFWGGFVIFWEAAALRENAPFPFALFGIPFVLIGLYLIFGRFIMDAWQREKTYYGLTNERVIVVSGLLRQQLKSLNLRTLTDISLTEKSDRSGTITFGGTPPFYSWFSGVSWPGMGQYIPPSIEMIENARQVYEQIRRVQREAS